MRLLKVLPATLALATISVLVSGCASRASGPRDVSLFGGLYESREAAFEQQTSTGIPVNTDKPSRNKRMSGDKVSILWGLFTFRDQ